MEYLFAIWAFCYILNLLLSTPGTPYPMFRQVVYIVALILIFIFVVGPLTGHPLPQYYGRN